MAKRKSAGNATILQVAALAGLSIATVSRVLNGGKYVAESTRQKVLDAVAELDYKPNYMARQLHGEDGFVIAVILGMERGTISPFALKVYEALKVQFHAQGYRVKRASFNENGELLTSAKAYVSIGLHETDIRYREVIEEEAPLINVGDLREGAFWVASNDEQGGYLATKHLLNNGCRTIYYVCPDKHHDVSRNRQKGYCRAMHEAGLVVAEPIEVGIESGLPALDSYRRIRGLMEAGLRPDAFVAFSDILATGICMALADTGNSVPKDVQVIGYDGIDSDSFNSLSTICQDIEGLAGKTVELAMDAIQGKEQSGHYLDIILRQGHTTVLAQD